MLNDSQFDRQITGLHNSFVRMTFERRGWGFCLAGKIAAVPRKKLRPASDFLGRQGLDRQRVDIGLHHFAQGRKNDPVATESRFAVESA